MTGQTTADGEVEFFILHRMPKPAAGLGMRSAALARCLEQCAAALDAGFDGCLLPASADMAETLAVDGFTLAGCLLERARRGKVGLADVSLAMHAPDEIIRRAAVLAGLAPGRLELGLSLGRPRDLWAANIHAGRARKAFYARLEALLWALGYSGGSPDMKALPEFRTLQAWENDLSAPEIFLSGTYCAENRAAIQRFELPWLSYGDPFDVSLDAEGSKGRDLVLRVDMTGQAGTGQASELGNDRLFGARGAQPGYFDAEEYRQRLVVATGSQAEFLSGSATEVAGAIHDAARQRSARRIVIDPCIEGLNCDARDANFDAVSGELLPALREGA